MKNVMLDLETMGNGSNAAIVSIGACFFDIKTGEIGDTFERVIYLPNSASHGQIDGDTVLWWLKQSDDARAKLDDPDAVSLAKALQEFSQFINLQKVSIWGNGASFDNVILSNAYKAVNQEPPWRFFNDRDVRTVVALGRELLGFDPKKDMPFDGTQHSALDDAKHQARYVSAIYQKLSR